MRTIITGPGRVGSVWLAKMLAQQGAPVEHEPFHQGTWPEGFHRWLALGDDAIMVSHYAREVIPEILAACGDCRWLMLWRDPVDLILSYLARDAFTAQFPPPAPIWLRARVLARQQLGDLEATLSLFASLGIDVAHWHFDHYTTPDGFRGLAESAGVTVQDTTMIGRANETPDNARIPHEAIDPESVAYILAIHREMPLTRRAWSSATARTM